MRNGAPGAAGESPVRLLVLYHSTRGHTELMAYAAADGACRAGVEVDVKRVPDLLAPGEAQALGHKTDQPAQVADPAELRHYDGLIVGCDGSHGRPCAAMAHFLERAAVLAAAGALRGKVGGAFVATATQHGGHEAALLSLVASLLHFGLTVVGLDPGFAGLQALAAAEGGSPYGAGTLTAPDGSRWPSALELDGARYQGGRIAETALALCGA